MRKFFIASLTSIVLLFFCSCKNDEKKTEDTQEKKASSVVYDAQTFANIHEVHTTHLHLNLTVDFEKKIISGLAQHVLSAHTVDSIVFDTKGLIIKKITLDDAQDTAAFHFGKTTVPELGVPLIVSITPKTKTVNIYYETTPSSEALDWLSPNLTAGKKFPFMYSQGEAILTRTWIPIQGSPSNRITYSADLQVPKDLLALMSATNPTEKNPEGKYHFEMHTPIPCYLISIAVGDMKFKATSEITGIYADPSLIDTAAWELGGVIDMIHAAEKLYGPYQWGRYDVLVLPTAFPYGGMENPRLTFATPTILAGDKSLVSLVAHELAHSWSGNLVTNATWDDFWLNEGFTVYFENRIMEATAGKEIADMLILIEYQELLKENEAISKGPHPEDTHLKLNLAGRNPDDGMTSIAYVKGAYFLRTIENTVGREKFDVFLKSYFDSHQFQTITTEQFVAYLKKNLLDPNKIQFNVDEWVYGPGIPSNCVKVSSARFDRVNQLAEAFCQGKKAADLGITRASWITQEWMNFIRKLPDTISVERLKDLDQTFNLKGWGNAEIMAEWFLKSIRAGYTDIRPEMKAFLTNIGRRKFLQPIYAALAETPDNKKWALEVYKLARPNYHSVSFNTIDAILGFKAN